MYKSVSGEYVTCGISEIYDRKRKKMDMSVHIIRIHPSLYYTANIKRELFRLPCHFQVHYTRIQRMLSFKHEAKTARELQ